LPWRTIEILDEMRSRHTYTATNELYLTHANDELCREARVLVHRIEGKWITTGDLVSFLTASIEYALRHDDPKIARGVADYLRGLDLGK
jgi:UTP-glucose-1-phosphate uridylyltransferase